jgi:hypothetical protein
LGLPPQFNHLLEINIPDAVIAHYCVAVAELAPSSRFLIALKLG